jgi:hypothetical protein
LSLRCERVKGSWEERGSQAEAAGDGEEGSTIVWHA